MSNFFKPLSDILLYIRMFQYYLGARMYLIFMFSLISSLLEGLGILMLLPLLEGLGGLEQDNFGENGVSLFLFRLFNFFGLSFSTISVLSVIVVLFVLKGIITMITLSINSLHCPKIESDQR